MPLPGQVQSVIVTSAVLILVPLLFGLLVASVGDGQLVWLDGAVALVCTSLGLALFIGPHGPGLGALSELLNAVFLSVFGLLLAIGGCTVAIIHARRELRFAQIVVVLLTAALPVLAAIVLFDLVVLVIGPANPGEPVNGELTMLTFVLVSVGCAGLTLSGIWSSLHSRFPKKAAR